jgi:hypothetical protein
VSQLEAWQMVHVSSDFLNTNHGKIKCVACHGGDETSDDKDGAHQNIIVLPSDNEATFCSSCHEGISNNYSVSLHKKQQGYLKRIENRLGYSIENDATLMGHFDKECGKCHVSCGQCHVSRPVSVKGGFISGHNFGEPTRDNNCVACHGSRVGAEYMGQNESYYADAHRYKPGGAKCTFCHSGDEMHSSGAEFDYRYLDTDMPRCEYCHDEKKDANIYHQKHWADQDNPSLSCHVCHSQPYKNCDGCHTGGSGITGSSYFKFKIAKNKFNLESVNRVYDYVTVRHIPIAPDTYASWGIADLPNFDSEPTWKYTTPHNIQKWTAQTDTTGTYGKCGANCHDSREYYLMNSDLLDYEIEANKSIIMDDKVPN